MFWRNLAINYPFWSLLGATSAVYLRNRWMGRVRPVLIDELEKDSQELLNWQSDCGYNAHGLVSILPESRAWRDPLGRGVVCYLDIGKTWLAAGDPFAPVSDLSAVMVSFLKAARRADKLAVFVPA